ncbi:MAG: hypothetical protein J6Q11_06090 [Fibrobacteraceae bacterium]|nr:hypothetical protein [Fibrobacteraceae bacterium]
MKPIGGYFEWEFSLVKKTILHENAVYLNSGRHALEYILQGLQNIKCLWIPYFTCDVVLQPLQKLNIPYKFYRISADLELSENIELGDGEYLLYTNYYGIKDDYCNQIAEKYGDRAIIDNAQALFCKPIVGKNQFYSPRKFMGMPDGGIAVTNFPNTENLLPVDQSFDRCSHLLKRHELIPAEGYNEFKENSRKITAAPLSQMSTISQKIFKSVDLEFIKKRRRENFETLHKSLGDSNRLNISSLDSFECPLVYPYWSDDAELKKKLIEKSIFVATYWPNVFEWCKPDDLEYNLASNVVCIPIDQRYEIEDMDRIVKEIERC